MACVGLRSGGGLTAHNHRAENRVRFPGRAPSRVSVVTTKKVKCPPAMSMAMTASCTAIDVANGSGTHVGGPEKFDRWMRESVGEIVQNLRGAPLFVHVYGGGGPETKLKTEKAIAKEWAHLKGKWVRGEEPSPEGIILVEELKEDDLGIYEEDEGQYGDCTKAWGVLIQGKGEDGGVACYLLKTSKVGCSNLGLFCTHYCLVKVNSFRETARSQLTSCWLA